jgi:hypothetical protein
MTKHYCHDCSQCTVPQGITDRPARLPDYP